MKLIGTIRGIKKVHKDATADRAAHDVLEFKVESQKTSEYDNATALSGGQVEISVKSQQRTLTDK
jgi:hypothetical protein